MPDHDYFNKTQTLAIVVVAVAVLWIGIQIQIRPSQYPGNPALGGSSPAVSQPAASISLPFIPGKITVVEKDSITIEYLVPPATPDGKPTTTSQLIQVPKDAKIVAWNMKPIDEVNKIIASLNAPEKINTQQTLPMFYTSEKPLALTDLKPEDIVWVFTSNDAFTARLVAKIIPPATQ